MSDTEKGDGAYRVLARKYRPADFTALIGQEPMVRTLTNAFEAGRIAQAWMLTGVRGVGKTTTARILARALNYKTDAVDRPSVDLSVPGIHCQAIMEGRHVDVMEMDAASHTGIDDIKQIIDSVRYAPVSARYKVYIIDEIHMLSDKAFNALLKTLEEPPAHVKFIFATTEIRKVPITILSRCQRFDLRRIETGDLAAHLASIAEKEGIEADGAALALIARAGEGSVRDSLSILDQAIAHGSGRVDVETVRAMLGLADRTRIVDLFEHLMAGRVAEALAEYRSQYDAGADPLVILNDLAEFTHLVTRLRFVPQAAEADPTMSPDERERGLSFSKSLAVNVLARAWQMLLKGISETSLASRPVAAAEMVLIRIAHAANLPTLDEALKQLDSAPAASGARPQGTSASAGHGGNSNGNGNGHGGASAVSGQTMPQGAGGNQPVASAAAGGAGAVRLVASRMEEDAAPDLQPAPAPQAAPAVPVNSLEDLAALAEKHRDPLMKVNIRKCVRLVSIAPGKLAVHLTQDAPASLLGDLSKRLNEWTGTRWVVSLSREEGGPTLEEIEGRKREALVADASRDPSVSAVLAAFPGARIIDVRLGDVADDGDLAADDYMDMETDPEMPPPGMDGDD